jgi:PIN domain nuclease of toxin-antitoxin system
MTSPLLLDTCALIFLTIDGDQAGKVRAALKQAYDANQTVFVSPISAWEVGMLASLKRVNLLASPQRWFDTVIETPGVRLAELPPAVLIASSFLPDTPWRDPADRIMAATAREYGFTLLTRDKRLLAYAAKGHIRALPC